MKTSLSGWIFIFLLLLLSGPVLGAVHPFKSNYFNQSYSGTVISKWLPENEKWFDATEPIGYNNSIDLLFQEEAGYFGFKYYQNEQTFGSFGKLSLSPNQEIYALRESYLFDCGLFLGLDCTQVNNIVSLTLVSAGYRFRLPEDQNYLAISVDGNDTNILGYELDAKYYYHEAQLLGEIYKPDGESGCYIMVGGNVPLTEELTVGLKYERMKEFDGYNTGLTCVRNQVVLNCKMGKDMFSESNYYAVGGSYHLNEYFLLGLDFGKIGDLDAGYAVRLAYQAGIVSLNLCYKKDFFITMPVF